MVGGFMQLQVYKSFLAVVKCRSFTQAAQFLNFTQPTISNHITALEETYGVKLLVREGKNLYLTTAGKAFVAIAEAMVQDYTEGLQQMRTFQQQSDKLRIAVSTQTINYYLLDILSQLRQELPQLEIEVHRCMTAESTLEDTFQKKLYDLAFVHVNIQPLDAKRIELWQQPILWTCSRELYETYKQSNNIYDYPFIGYRTNSVYYKLMQKQVDFTRLKQVLAFSDSETIILAVKKSLGISMLPEFKFRKERAEGSLVVFPAQYNAAFNISLLYECDLEFTPPMRRFVELVLRTKNQS
ncbi:MAG: LysR family transcriptional regulator [Acidaminococcaceae bacterium]